jgi:hypothetical protein
MKKKSFFYHYNKPASLAQKRNVLSVHYKGVCHLVHKIHIKGLNVESRDRKTQPRCVMAGKANNFAIFEQDGLNIGILS